jgi:hypothetical protein
MGWDSLILPVPEIPYESDLYNDCEDAVVAWLKADAYLAPGTGDGGIVEIKARPITMNDVDNLFGEVNIDMVPAVYVDAQGKQADDSDGTAGMWFVPMNVLIAVFQCSSDLTVLDNNVKRRLGEVERAMRQLAGSQASGYWNGTEVIVEGSTIFIGIRPEDQGKGVGWLALTIRKAVLNRLEGQ